MNKKKKKLTLILRIVLLSIICLACAIFSAGVGVIDNNAITGISVLCSLFGIVLSAYALWYTFKSGLHLDEQFDDLKQTIQKMRALQHDIDQTINRLEKIKSELPPELKAKIDNFKSDLDADDFSVL